MRKQEGSTCEICRRLGKTECGYHQFKNQYLSNFSKSVLEENQFAQTQSSINRNDPTLTLSAHARTFTPTKVDRSRINFNYQQSQSPFRPIAINTPPSQPQSRICYTPPKPVQPIVHYPPSPYTAQNHIIRVEGTQVLYYPIYPVYEVVYEPVSVASSLSPSSIIQ